MTHGNRLETRHLPSVLLKGPSVVDEPSDAKSLSEARQAFDREYILKKLEENQGNVTRTAEALGIERSHLYRKLKLLKVNTERS